MTSNPEISKARSSPYPKAKDGKSCVWQEDCNGNSKLGKNATEKVKEIRNIHNLVERNLEPKADDRLPKKQESKINEAILNPNVVGNKGPVYRPKSSVLNKRSTSRARDLHPGPQEKKETHATSRTTTILEKPLFHNTLPLIEL